MECEQCGLVSEQGSINGICPFCGTRYPKVIQEPVTVVLSAATARKLRDLNTEIAGCIADLFTRIPATEQVKHKDLFRRVYEAANEDAEYYDDMLRGRDE